MSTLSFLVSMPIPERGRWGEGMARWEWRSGLGIKGKRLWTFHAVMVRICPDAAETGSEHCPIRPSCPFCSVVTEKILFVCCLAHFSSQWREIIDTYCTQSSTEKVLLKCLGWISMLKGCLRPCPRLQKRYFPPGFPWHRCMNFSLVMDSLQKPIKL